MEINEYKAYIPGVGLEKVKEVKHTNKPTPADATVADMAKKPHAVENDENIKKNVTNVAAGVFNKIHHPS